jgi:hypothetical protein
MAKLVAPACYGSSLSSNPDISQNTKRATEATEWPTQIKKVIFSKRNEVKLSFPCFHFSDNVGRNLFLYFIRFLSAAISNSSARRAGRFSL